MDWMIIWSWARGILGDVVNIVVLFVMYKVWKSVDGVGGLLKQIRDK